MQRMPSEAWTGELGPSSHAGKVSNLSCTLNINLAAIAMVLDTVCCLLQAGIRAQETPPARGVGQGLIAEHLHDPLCCALEHLWILTVGIGKGLERTHLQCLTVRLLATEVQARGYAGRWQAVSKSDQPTTLQGDGEVRRREDLRRRQTKPTTTLFVVNFDVDKTRERDLEKHFEPFGKLRRVQIKRNYAFIQYEDVDQSADALKACNGTCLAGGLSFQALGYSIPLSGLHYISPLGTFRHVEEPSYNQGFIRPCLLHRPARSNSFELGSSASCGGDQTVTEIMLPVQETQGPCRWSSWRARRTGATSTRRTAAGGARARAARPRTGAAPAAALPAMSRAAPPAARLPLSGKLPAMASSCHVLCRLMTHPATSSALSYRACLW